MQKRFVPWVYALLGLGLLVFLYFGLGSALLPLVASFFLTYLLFPVVSRLERAGVRRQLAVIAVLTCGFALFVLSLVLLIPAIFHHSKLFILDLPSNAEKLLHRIELFTSEHNLPLYLSRDTMVSSLKQWAESVSPETLLAGASNFLKNTSTNLVGVVVGGLNLFLFPVFFFFMVNEYEKITQKMHDLIPPRFHAFVDRYLDHTNDILKGYVRGQLLVCLIIGTLYALGLSAIGLRYGFLIGYLTGVLNLIPFFGFTFGFVSGVVIALVNEGWVLVFQVIAVFAVVQLIESYAVTPKIVGNRVGLNSLTTMLALIIGANIAGLVGMLVAVPIASLGKRALSDLKHGYRSSDFFQGKEGV